MSTGVDTQPALELVASNPSLPTPGPLLYSAIAFAHGWGRFSHEYWTVAGCNPAKAPLVSLQRWLFAASSLAHTPIHALVVAGPRVVRVTPFQPTAPGTGYRLPMVVMLQLHADGTWRALGIRAAPSKHAGNMAAAAGHVGQDEEKAEAPVHTVLVTLHALETATAMLQNFASTLHTKHAHITRATEAAAAAACTAVDPADDPDGEEELAAQRRLDALQRGEDALAAAAAEAAPGWWPAKK